MSRLEERLEKCEKAQVEAMQARSQYQEAQWALKDEQGNLLEVLLTDVGPSQAVASGCISVNLSAVRRMVYPREGDKDEKKRCTYAWEVIGILHPNEIPNRHGIFRHKKDAMVCKDKLIEGRYYSKFGVAVERVEIIEET